MNENYQQNNFILFFLVKVQYKKKTKTIQTYKTRKQRNGTSSFFFLSRKLEITSKARKRFAPYMRTLLFSRLEVFYCSCRIFAS